MKFNISSVFAANNRWAMAILLAICVTAGCDTPSAPATSESEAPAESSSESSKAQPAPVDRKVGVLIVSHGSRSKSWRKMLSDIENAVHDDILSGGNIDGVRSAFMEYSEPSIAAQLKAFDQEGYDDVILVPLLLTVSSHSFDDIPTIIGQKEDRMTLETLKQEGIEVYKTKARTTIAPLLDFPEILGKNLVRRVKQMSEKPEEEGVVLVAYGSEPYEEEWTELLNGVAKELSDATGIDCVKRCWCGHIVHYNSKPTELTIKTVLEQKQRAIVLPVLIAVDENFQGRIIGGAIKSVGKPERIVYRHDSILPDDNVNQWVVDISRKLAAKLADKDEASSNTL